MLTKEQLHYKTFSFSFAVTFSSLQGGLLQSHSRSWVTLVQQHYVSLLSVPLDKGNVDSGINIGSAQEKGLWLYLFFFYLYIIQSK